MRLVILYEPPQKTVISMLGEELDIVDMSLGEPVCGAIA